MDIGEKMLVVEFLSVSGELMEIKRGKGKCVVSFWSIIFHYEQEQLSPIYLHVSLKFAKCHQHLYVNISSLVNISAHYIIIVDDYKQVTYKILSSTND